MFIYERLHIMNSFIGWVGGKKALRGTIIDMFPSPMSGRYVEVFGGAGWVLFGKEKETQQMEVFNDIDSDLINMYRCIQNHQEEFNRQFEFVLFAHETFDTYKEDLARGGLTDIQRAARYFYLIKNSFGCRKVSYATRPRSIEHALKRLSEVKERLRGVLIENRNYDDLIKLYDSDDTLFYLDPPYHGTEKLYKDNGTVFTTENHVHLRDILKNIKGKFILSYNDDAFIRSLYQDFEVVGVERNSTLCSTSDNTTKYKELIIKNF